MEIAAESGSSPEKTPPTEELTLPEELLVQVQTNDSDAILFRLNDSTAASSLYRQLPLAVQIEDYAGSEKIFHPPEKLDVSNTPLAQGPAGTLAYYEPWGDVVFFYAACKGASGLYELGEAVSGAELIPTLSGEIRITEAEESAETDGASSASAPPQEEKTIASAPPAQTKPDSSAPLQESKTTASTLPQETEPSAPAPDPVVSTPEPDQQVTMQQPSSQENFTTMPLLQIEVGNKNFTATLYDNATTRALIQKLPLTLTMSEMNGNEKYHYFADGLPTNANRPAGIHAGDLMLYGPDCLVLFYESFSTAYSYTPLGSIDDPAGLSEALGTGDVQVRYRMTE
nr:cyclophilin-like fold protein [Clostridium sp. D33t1_170424_F3]